MEITSDGSEIWEKWNVYLTELVLACSYWKRSAYLPTRKRKCNLISSTPSKLPKLQLFKAPRTPGCPHRDHAGRSDSGAASIAGLGRWMDRVGTGRGGRFAFRWAQRRGDYKLAGRNFGSSTSRLHQHADVTMALSVYIIFNNYIV